MEKEFSFLTDLLPFGEANAVSAKQLARELNTDVRTVRDAVHRARIAGILILSGDAGYWRSDDRQELKRFCARMMSMGREVLTAAEAARCALEELEGGED